MSSSLGSGEPQVKSESTDTISIVVSHEDFTILSVSQSIEPLVGYGPEEVIGHPLTILIGEDQMRNLGSQLDSVDSLDQLDRLPCTICSHFSSEVGISERVFDDRAFNMKLQNVDGALVVNFHLSNVRPLGYVAIPVKSVANSIQKLRTVSKVEEVLNVSVKEMRKTVGVDRVMIYQFEEEDRIRICAEDKRDGLQSLLGSYVPEVARGQHIEEEFRIVRDLNSDPDLTSPREPFRDNHRTLSAAALKCVSTTDSPSNELLDIKFSISIPIIMETKLWGLIVCHHGSAKFVSHQLKTSAELLAQIISWKLSNVLTTIKTLYSRIRRVSMNKICNALLSTDNWIDAFSEEIQEIYQVFDVTGVAISSSSGIVTHGSTPSQEQVRLLVSHIVTSQEKDIFARDNLSREYEPAKVYKDIASGVLVMIHKILGGELETALLFRKEMVQDVKWVDQPDRSTTIEGCSVPWKAKDIQVAEELKRHILETKLRYYSRRLQEEADARARASEELQRKKALFIDTICHEIRNPINGILGSVSALLDLAESMRTRQGPQNPEALGSDRLLEYLRDIEDCANHQKLIANDVLTFSALEQRRFVLQNQPLNLIHALQHMLHPYKAIMADKGLSLGIEISQSEIYIQGDRNRLRQIVCNLMDNATKFTLEGFIKVSVLCHQPQAGNQSFEIQIQDSGPGMTEPEMDRLFVAYSQANNTISGKYGGTGLGLVICQELARLMNGYVAVSSVKNVGTRFTLYFSCPVVSREEYLTFGTPKIRGRSVTSPEETDVIVHRSPSLQRSATSTIERPGQTKVLIVEDNLINQKVLSRILSKNNYHCDIANNGQQGVSLYKLNRPEIIFMDIQMPIMDGLEATQQIREIESSLNESRSYIICLSGNARDEYRQQAFQNGVDAYLVKPLVAEEILDLMRRRPDRYVSGE